MINLLTRPKDRVILFPYVFRVLPMVEKELKKWRKKAAAIPSRELREQAENSLRDKRFHCQGGSFFALYPFSGTALPGKEMVVFIVALQTISDYLDNLCDRYHEPGMEDVMGNGMEEEAFTMLHRAMRAAVDDSVAIEDWYRYCRQGEADYLNSLIKCCRQSISHFPGYRDVRDSIIQLVSLYSNLQVNKHLPESRREKRLTQWLAGEYDYGISWWELAAATGSTLGVFALAAVAADGKVSIREKEKLTESYFPWICGLHILLDYYIDLDEDREHGDLNFVSYYQTPREIADRLSYFLKKSLQKAAELPRPRFHATVIKGLPALYLSDPKGMAAQGKDISGHLLRQGGKETILLHKTCLSLRRQGLI